MSEKIEKRIAEKLGLVRRLKLSALAVAVLDILESRGAVMTVKEVSAALLASGFDDGKALTGTAFSARLYTALKTLTMRGDVDRVLSNVGFVAASPDSGEFDFSTSLDFGDVVFCAERNCGRRLSENLRAVFADARLAPVLRVGILAGIQYALNRHSKFVAPASFNSRNPRRGKGGKNGS